MKFQLIELVEKEYEQLNKTKGQWMPDEDNLLIHLVERHGQQHWSNIAISLLGHRGKQCREWW